MKIFPIPILSKPHRSFLKVLEVVTAKELHINTRLCFVICIQKCFFLQQSQHVKFPLEEVPEEYLDNTTKMS